MTSSVSEIHNRVVESVVAEPGELAICFVDGWSIAIYNRYSVSDGIGTGLREILASMKGAALAHSEVSDSRLELLFDNKVKLTVGLRAEDYAGPEAAVVSGPSGEFIVVN